MQSIELKQIEHTDIVIDLAIDKDRDIDIDILPAFDKNNIALLFAASDNYMPYFSTILQSIIEHSCPENNYDLLIFHRNIKKESKDIIAKQIAEYKNFSVRFYNVISFFQSYMQNLQLNNYLTIETYFRLLAPYILTAYDKILYLDCDMVVQRDVADLYNIVLEDKYLLAACRDVDIIGGYNGYVTDRKAYSDNILQLKEPNNYFQAGVILFHLKIFRISFTSAEIMEFSISREWEYLDQDILNCLAADRVFFLNEAWNVLYDRGDIRVKDIVPHAPKEIYDAYKQARENPYIIHYAGPEKPWEYKTVDFAENWWKIAVHTPYASWIEEEFSRVEKERKKFLNRCKRGVKKILMPFVNLFFPKGSKRRKKLKKILHK